MVDRGTCSFSVKAKNAQLNGALGVIIANNAGGTAVQAWAWRAGFIPTIPALLVSQNNGTAIKTELLSTTVNATLNRTATTYDNVRWLMGEDATAFGGALRDMSTPTCYGNPGKVSDPQYFCGHGRQRRRAHQLRRRQPRLLADGGRRRPLTARPSAAIGLTKAAHVYFRAKIAYQGPATDFADHADALEQSCADLTGVNLASLTTGPVGSRSSRRRIATRSPRRSLAVEMRTPPTQCNFQPLLAQNPPAVCPAGKSPEKLFARQLRKRHGLGRPLDRDPRRDHSRLHRRDWSVVGSLPMVARAKRSSRPIPTFGTCAPGGDETAVLQSGQPGDHGAQLLSGATASSSTTGSRPRPARTAVT